MRKKAVHSLCHELEAENIVCWHEEDVDKKLGRWLARLGGQWSLHQSVRTVLVQAWCAGVDSCVLRQDTEPSSLPLGENMTPHLCPRPRIPGL